ncbi:short-chain dehydrogenase/reductase SDR [Rhizoctonia solani]|uniref:Short-chain dehydrogenase/reductase SDR n=1 Tax=Rhizoctonia solani TaxID=456999 RepID=A0A0K6FNE0_9AGAM|nr:short-chain dehydrogenase/reductase SDR [Rhizoctonia solani]
MDNPALDSLSASGLFDVTNQTALVTEGCSRTGVIIATTLVENGAKVYLASKDEVRLQEIQRELSRRGPGRCEYIIADLESKQGCVAFCAALKKREYCLHILVNNSGATWGGYWDDFPDTSWDLELASHVKSLLYVTGGLTELLAKAASASLPGRIINIPSNISTDSREAQTEAEQVLSYDTHKSAVSHLTTVLSTSLSSKYLSVNAILPDIAFAAAMHNNGDISSDGSRYLDSAQDLAGVLLFLASPVGARVTGARIESEATETHNITRCWVEGHNEMTSLWLAMPSPSKLIAPLKDAVKRTKGDNKPAEDPQAPAANDLVARDYVTVHPPSPHAPSEQSPLSATDNKAKSSSTLQNLDQAQGVNVHPLDVQSELASAYTTRCVDKIESESEYDQEGPELTDTQLRRLYDDEEIERFLTVFSKHVTEVTLAPSASSGMHRKAAVLRSNGQGGQGLETDIYDVDSSDTETDIDEPWTYLNSSDVPSEMNKTPTKAGLSPSMGEQPSTHPHPSPTFLSARVAAWIIPKLPPAPITPPHKFKISSFRLAGQRLYVSTYPFYTPFFANLTRLATWSDWSRSARVCAVWWVFWYFNLLLPALLGKMLVSLLRRRVMPYPSLKALRERRRLAREANEIGDAMEGHGAATSFFGTRAIPGVGQGGGDMGLRDILKLTRVVTKGKSKKGKAKLKSAESNVAAQVGLSSDDEEEDALEHQQAEDDWRTSALKVMESLADLHERVRNLWLWRRERSSRIYTLVLAIIFLLATLTPAQILAKITYAIIGVFYWFIVPVLLAMPPEARKRIPAPLFDIPTDAEYAMSLMSIRVAKGENIIPASLRGGREHGRARRFIANMSAEPVVEGATSHKDAEWGIPNPDQDVGDMRQEANEKEAVANRERAEAAGEGEDGPLVAEPSAEIGTLGRLKNKIEASTADLLGNDKDNSNASLQSIGAPQTVPANHKATPGTLSLNSEGISFTPLLTSHPRLRVPLQNIQGVKKTGHTNGLRVRHLTGEGIEHEDVFRFIPSRDEIFGKLVGWGGKRWQKVP